MDDSNDHRYLHLHTVNKIQIILSNRPNRIQPNRIHTLTTNPRYRKSRLSSLRIVTRAKNIQTDGQEIIIDPATVHSEEAHQCYQVAMG